MQAMILAAGRGTRLKPLTDVIPKALVPVGDKPLLQRVLDKMLIAGADHVVVNIFHHARQVDNFISLCRRDYPFPITISDESAELLETGGALKKARPLFTDEHHPVLIHNVDILSNVDLAELYSNSNDADATLLVSDRGTQRYLLFRKDDMRLVGWTNIATGEVRSPFADIQALNGQPDQLAQRFKRIKHQGGTIADDDAEGCMLAFSGIHCIQPSMLTLMSSWPDRFPIMDFYLRTAAEKNIKGIFKPDLKLLDVGKLDTLAAAESFLGGMSLMKE